MITIVQAYDISTSFSFLPKKHNKLLACIMFHLNCICSEKIPLSLILNFLNFYSNLFFCFCLAGEQHSFYLANDGRHNLFFHSFPFLCLGVRIFMRVGGCIHLNVLNVPHSLLDFGLTNMLFGKVSSRTSFQGRTRIIF